MCRLMFCLLLGQSGLEMGPVCSGLGSWARDDGCVHAGGGQIQGLQRRWHEQGLVIDRTRGRRGTQDDAWVSSLHSWVDGLPCLEL